MFNISSFLEKFSKNVQSAELQKKQILDIIEKNIHLQLSLEEIEIKDYIIRITASPGALNKIFIYKSKILEDISNTTSIKVVDIK